MTVFEYGTSSGFKNSDSELRGRLGTFFLKCSLLKNLKPGLLFLLTVSVADPDPGSGAFLTPWIRDPGWVESQHPDPG